VIEAALAAQLRIHAGVFTNTKTAQPFTVNGVAHLFDRAVERTDIMPGDVSLHTSRNSKRR